LYLYISSTLVWIDCCISHFIIVTYAYILYGFLCILPFGLPLHLFGSDLCWFVCTSLATYYLVPRLPLLIVHPPWVLFCLLYIIYSLHDLVRRLLHLPGYRCITGYCVLGSAVPPVLLLYLTHTFGSYLCTTRQYNARHFALPVHAAWFPAHNLGWFLPQPRLHSTLYLTTPFTRL